MVNQILKKYDSQELWSPDMKKLLPDQMLPKAKATINNT